MKNLLINQQLFQYQHKLHKFIFIHRNNNKIEAKKAQRNRSMMRIGISSSSAYPFLFLGLVLIFTANAVNQVNGVGRLVKREDRRQIVNTDCGAISAVDIESPSNQMYHHQLQFISLDPNSIFLPALLHADMVLYLHTGSGQLSYTDGNEMESRKVNKGDVYRLKSGSVFYIESSEQELQLLAIFSDAAQESTKQETWVGPYSGIRDLFQGFDTRLLQAAFQAPEEVMEEIVKAAEMAPIVEAHPESSATAPWKRETVLFKTLLEINRVEKDLLFLQRNKKKHKKDKDKEEEEETSFNLFKAKRQVDNCDGWSTMLTPKDLHHKSQEEGLSIGAFMLSLRPGAMAGPHWNPSAIEIAVVVQGRGMVRAVCSSGLTRRECNNTRFLVERGDVVAIPRSHPMAQMSFNNESLVLMGFSLPTGGGGASGPRFLAGKDSFLNAVDNRVLELALNVNGTTISQLLALKKAESIKKCISCAEEEEERMMEEEGEVESREERRRWPEEEEEDDDEDEGEWDEDEGEWDGTPTGKGRLIRMRAKMHNM
ncbi:hypothetical protein V2J09_009167 [Rumex salicifolius]